MSAGPADSWARPAWLTPSAAGALALAAADVSVLLSDAPIVAHVVRFVRPELTPLDDPFTPARLADPGLLDALAHGLERSRTPLPMVPPNPRVMFARRAALFALDPGRDFGVPPGLAAAAVRLLDLGHDAAALAGRFPPTDTHTAARLAARLGVPAFLVTLLATHDLPADDAEACGAHAGLVHAVRAALARAEADPGPAQPFDAPHIDRPRLVQLLRATAAARRAGQGLAAEALAESAIRRLAVVRAEFPGRVRDAKLAGLAEFAAGASHEINNPLAVIRGHAQLLLAHETDPGRRAQLETIVHQTARVHDLLQGTRQFARPPAPRVGPVDVAVALASVLDHLRIDAARRNVTLSAPLVAGSLVVAADAGQVAQIFTHVIRNAADAAPPGGWVRVTPAAAGESVTITVEDSGPGPDPAHVPHLFDPFFSGRDAGRGRGLGLSIAWRLAGQNGGAVSLTTPPGGPTRFTVTLPRHEAAACRRAA